MRTMISDILAQAGFEVVGEAETGVQAVERYKQLKPDLVTMDIVMPDMGGIDAVREIVKHDPDAKILMCSAMGQRSEEHTSELQSQSNLVCRLLLEKKKKKETLKTDKYTDNAGVMHAH